MTHGSAIRIAYRTSLRSSSLWEPRYPSLRIWFLFVELSKAPLFDKFVVAAAAARPAYARSTAAATEG